MTRTCTTRARDNFRYECLQNVKPPRTPGTPRTLPSLKARLQQEPRVNEMSGAGCVHSPGTTPNTVSLPDTGSAGQGRDRCDFVAPRAGLRREGRPRTMRTPSSRTGWQVARGNLRSPGRRGVPCSAPRLGIYTRAGRKIMVRAVPPPLPTSSLQPYSCDRRGWQGQVMRWVMVATRSRVRMAMQWRCPA